MTPALWLRTDKQTHTTVEVAVGVAMRAAQGFGQWKEFRAGAFETARASYRRVDEKDSQQRSAEA